MRQYQTTGPGAGILVSKRNGQLTDHVGRALAEARAGRRAWIKSLSGDVPRDQDLDRFYSIEFRNRDGRIEITCFESALIINPDHVFTPPWVTLVVNTARRILNPDLIGATPCPPAPPSTN